ncbi:hypothetical protein [Actinocorallia aurea]
MRTRLTLAWMVEGGSYRETGDSPREAFTKYVREVAPRVSRQAGLGRYEVPLLWWVVGRDERDHEAKLFEVPAPFGRRSFDGEPDFLEQYTVPRSSDRGLPVNWLCDVPVEPEGFMSPALGGWRPSPLCASVNLRLLAAAAGLPLPAEELPRLRPLVRRLAS